MQVSETILSVLVQSTVPQQLPKRGYSDLPSQDQSSDCRVDSEAFYFCGKKNVHWALAGRKDCYGTSSKNQDRIKCSKVSEWAFLLAIIIILVFMTEIYKI